MAGGDVAGGKEDSPSRFVSDKISPSTATSAGAVALPMKSSSAAVLLLKRKHSVSDSDPPERPASAGAAPASRPRSMEPSRPHGETPLAKPSINLGASLAKDGHRAPLDAGSLAVLRMMCLSARQLLGLASAFPK